MGLWVFRPEENILIELQMIAYVYIFIHSIDRCTVRLIVVVVMTVVQLYW